MIVTIFNPRIENSMIRAQRGLQFNNASTVVIDSMNSCDFPDAIHVGKCLFSISCTPTKSVNAFEGIRKVSSFI